MATEDNDRLVGRLKASKRNLDSVRYQRAFTDGRHWARQHADLLGFQQLAELRASHGDAEWENLFVEREHATLAPCEILGMHLLGLTDVEPYGSCRGEAREIWEDRETDPNSLRGFADGALAIWEEVREEVEAG